MEGLVSDKPKPIPTKAIEQMLLGLSYSNGGGWKVTLQISADDAAYFDAHTAKKGKLAGQRYQTVYVLLNDDEMPDATSLDHEKKAVTEVSPLRSMAAFANAAGEKAERVPSKPRGPSTEAQRAAMSGFCGLAVRWCLDEHFQEWLAFTYPEQWALMTSDTPAGAAPQLVKYICKIESRKELDTDDQAHRLFDTLIRHPYAACRKADGLQD